MKARLLLDDAQGRAGDPGGRRCSAGRRARSSTSSAPTRKAALRPVDGRAHRGRATRSSRRASTAGEQRRHRGAEPAPPGRAGAARGAERPRGAPAASAAAAAVNISEPFIRRPVATTLLMIGLLARGPHRLPRSCRSSALPQVDYPTIVVSTHPARRERRDDGLGGDDAARAPVRADAVARADDVGVQLRQLADHAAVRRSIATSTPPSRTCRRRSTRRRTCCRARCRRRRPTARATRPTRRSSRWRSARTRCRCRQVDDYADSILAQKISQVSGVGLVTLNGGQKPAVRVQVDPAALAGHGPRPRGRARGAGRRQRQPAEGQPRRAAPELHARHQRSARRTPPALRAADHRLQERRAGAPARTWPRCVDGVENAQLAGWAGAQRAVILNVQRQPGANIIEVADRVKALLPAAARRRCRRGSR